MKVTNTQLARFSKLQTQIPKLSQERDGIKKAILGAGSTATRDYVATVKTRRRVRLVGKNEFIRVLGEGFLREKKLFQTSREREITVTRKGKK